MQEENQQRTGELDSEQKNQLKATLLTSPEGRLLLTGVALAFTCTLWLGVKLLVSPQDSQVLVGMTATQILPVPRACRPLQFIRNYGPCNAADHYRRHRPTYAQNLPQKQVLIPPESCAVTTAPNRRNNADFACKSCKNC